MANLSWSEKSSSIPSMCSSSYYASNNNNNQSTIQKTRLDDKIESVTAGLQDYYVRLIKKQLSQNAETIADYIFAMNIEVNPSMHHRSSQIRTLCYLSEFHKQKPFSKMTREDVLQYLNSNRRSEESDPLHKWIGTYNLRRIYLLRFFKWLYNHELEPSKRLVQMS